MCGVFSWKGTGKQTDLWPWQTSTSKNLFSVWRLSLSSAVSRQFQSIFVEAGVVVFSMTCVDTSELSLKSKREPSLPGMVGISSAGRCARFTERKRGEKGSKFPNFGEFLLVYFETRDSFDFCFAFEEKREM